MVGTNAYSVMIMSYLTPYHSQKISLLTQHGKESVIIPELANIECKVIHVNGFDTDQLGKFTRDKARAGSQIEAARKKARIGMQLAGLPLGIANEGAFSADPVMGIIPWNDELVILIDDVRNIEITAYADSKAQHFHKLVDRWADLEDSLNQFNFPTHYLVVRPDHEHYPRYIAGINNVSGLQEAFDWALQESINKKVFVENDLRAFANPTRMATIAQATKQLVQKMQSFCPRCQVPGFWVTEKIPGKECAICKLPTKITKFDHWTCSQCNYSDDVLVNKDPFADPKFCDHCNP